MDKNNKTHHLQIQASLGNHVSFGKIKDIIQLQQLFIASASANISVWGERIWSSSILLSKSLAVENFNYQLSKFKN